jgi:hypothetical protein
MTISPESLGDSPPELARYRSVTGLGDPSEEILNLQTFTFFEIF